MASRLMSKNFPGETPQNGTVPKKNSTLQMVTLLALRT